MTTQQPIKIAILAMGGEGGGVLADWIVDMGEANGWYAQTTSVPGVAQRTGATIYYVELFPGAGQPGAAGGHPAWFLQLAGERGAPRTKSGGAHPAPSRASAGAAHSGSS